MGSFAHFLSLSRFGFPLKSWALWPMYAFRCPTMFTVAVSWELIWTRPAVDVDHPLLAQEVIGAPREARFQEESLGRARPQKISLCEKGGT